MKLTNSLYQHLVQLRLFEPKQSYQSFTTLTPAQQVLVENATAASLLLKSILEVKQRVSTRPLTPIPQLDQMKQVVTSSTKLYNWNIIIEAMKILQVPHEIDQDIKKLILLGDPQIIEEVMQNIYSHYEKLTTQKPMIPAQLNQSIDQNKSKLDKKILLNQSRSQPNIHNNQASNLISNILSKALNLQKAQLATLFADNYNYLAQVFIKGVQRAYEPILQFYDEVLTRIDEIIELCVADKNISSMQFVLSVLHPGLVSKSSDVTIAAIKTLGAFAIKVYNSKINFQEDMYIWYRDQCLNTTILAIKRHPSLTDSLVDLIMCFCKHHLIELFTDTLRNNPDQLMIVEKIFGSLNEQSLNEINSMGILQQWLETALDVVDNNLKVDDQVAVLRLIYKIWLKWHAQFLEYQHRVHTAFKNASLSPSSVVQLFGLLSIFQLVEYFGRNKINEAPLLYKLLSVLLTQVKKEESFHFILQNVQLLIVSIPSIPLSVILDPLVNQLQQQTYPSLIVFQFLNWVSSQPLSIKSQIQLLDLLCKIAIYDTIHYQMASEMLLRMVQNSIDEESTQEFIKKFCKVSLAVYFALFKNGCNKVNEKQRSSQIIEVLKALVRMNSETFNNSIRVFGAHTNQQFKIQLGAHNKGLNSLLNTLGNASELNAQAEQEWEKQKQLKNVYSESSIKEVSDVQQSLKKYSKQKVSKEEQYKLASLRMGKQADPKIVEELQTIKKAFKGKVLEQQLKEQELEQKLQQQKIKVRTQLEKRQLQQGVALLNTTDLIVKLIYPFNSRETELAQEKKHGLLIFDLLDLNLEEDFHIQLYENLVKQNRKLFKTLFSIYANSIQIKSNSLFESIGQSLGQISVPEIIKFANDFELGYTHQQIQQLARQISVQILKNKTELKEFDYQGFLAILLQLAVLFVRDNNIYPHQCMEIFIKQLRTVTASKGESVQLFDHPEQLYFQQEDVIKEYNDQLLKNPDFELPVGFKKEPITQIKLGYHCENVPYEILNDIIRDAIGVQIIEPVSEKVTIFRVRPDNFGHIQNKLMEDPSQKQFKISHSTPHIQKKVLEIEPLREFSLNMKMAMSKYPLRDRGIVTQVANLLDDMLFAVENGKDKATRAPDITNKVLEEKKKQKELESLQNQEREERRKARESYVKEQLKANSMKTKMEELEKERLLRQSQEQEKKKLEDNVKLQHQIEIKKHIQVKTQKEKEEALKLQEKELKIKQQQEMKKKLEFQEFNQQQIKKLKDDLDDEEQIKTLQKKKLEEQAIKDKLIFESVRNQISQVDKERVILEKQLADLQISKFKAMDSIIAKNSFALQYLFDFLIKETFYKIGTTPDREKIPMKTFAWFADRFNFCPEVLSIDEVVKIFRLLTKDKEIVDKEQIQINYEEFLQALFKVTVRGCKTFNKVAIKIKESALTEEQLRTFVQQQVEEELEHKRQLRQTKLPKKKKIPEVVPESKSKSPSRRYKGTKEEQRKDQVLELRKKLEDRKSEIAERKKQLQSAKSRSKSRRRKRLEDELKQSVQVMKKSEVPLNNASQYVYSNDELLKEQKRLEDVNLSLYQTTEETFEAFLLFLDLSKDRTKLDLRFKKALEDKPVPNGKRMNCNTLQQSFRIAGEDNHQSTRASQMIQMSKNQLYMKRLYTRESTQYGDQDQLFKTDLLWVQRSLTKIKPHFEDEFVLQDILYIIKLLIHGKFMMSVDALKYLYNLKGSIQKVLQYQSDILKHHSEALHNLHATIVTRSRNLKISKYLERYIRLYNENLQIALEENRNCLKLGNFTLVRLEWSTITSIEVAQRILKVCQSLSRIFESQLSELQKQKLQEVVCRICEQKIGVTFMRAHCSACVNQAAKRKKLLQVNIQLSDTSQLAQKLKQNMQLELGKIKLQQEKIKKKTSPIKQVLRRTQTIELNSRNKDREGEMARIIQAMQLVLNYTEKVLNCDNDDQKFNVRTMSELNDARNAIEDEEAVAILGSINQCILARMQCMNVRRRSSQSVSRNRFQTKMNSLQMIQMFKTISEDSDDSSSQSPYRQQQYKSQKSLDIQLNHSRESPKVSSFKLQQEKKVFTQQSDSSSDSDSSSKRQLTSIKQISHDQRSPLQHSQSNDGKSIVLLNSLEQYDEVPEPSKRKLKQIRGIYSPQMQNSETLSSSSSSPYSDGSMRHFPRNKNKAKKSIFHQSKQANSDGSEDITTHKGYNSDGDRVNLNTKAQTQITLSDFELLKPLGKGAYGWVYLAKKKGTGDEYAIKIIDCSCLVLIFQIKGNQIETLKAERNIFEILSGEFVVKGIYSFSHEHYLCFVQEYMPGGDFAHILQKYTALDEEYVTFYTAEIVLALEYLRSKNIVHRDLKPDNILLDSQGHAKLADFGLSETSFTIKLRHLGSQKDLELPKFLSNGHEFPEKRIIGTPDYIAPEILNGESITNASVDYWSLGVMMYEMLCGIPPFNDDSIEKIFDNIRNYRIEWPNISDTEEDSISLNAYDLISKLLTPDYHARIGHKTIEDIKQHPFFDKINWNTISQTKGLIINQGIQKEEHQSEKIIQFLSDLHKDQRPQQNIAIKLKQQLSNLERLDLLVSMSEQEADTILSNIYTQEAKYQRLQEYIIRELSSSKYSSYKNLWN